MEKKVTKKSIKTSLRVLFELINLHKKQLLWLACLSLVTAVAHGFGPYIIGQFFDALSNPSIYSFGTLIVPWTIILLGVWFLIQAISHVLDWRISTKSEFLANLIWLDYIANGFGRVLELPMSFHKKHKIGEVGDRINKSAQALYEIVGKIVINLTPQFLSILIALGIAFVVKPLLAWFLLAGTAVYIAIIVFSVRPLGNLREEYWTKINASFGDAYDALNNALPIKQSGAEKHEVDKISSGFKASLPLWYRMNGLWESLTLFQRLAVLTTQTVILVTALGFVASGEMTVGDLIAFFAYTTMIFEPFAVIAQNWQSVHNGIINIQEIESLMSIGPEKYEPKESYSSTIRGDISFKGVSFHYDESKPVIQDVSFEVKAGDIVALVGESGVGKSTLIDLIGGYHFPVSGSVLIDGIETRKFNLRSLRAQTAIVPQEVVLFNDTIIKNIKYGNFAATDEMIKEAARKAHALDFIEKFADKWEQTVGERGVKLSVGQKQRVAIARAILRDPRILILDEPTSALDAGSEKIITESLEKLMEGKTTFIIAHRLSTVRKANKILVFKEGRIIESGTHQELLTLKSGEYKRLYELQIGLHD